jgi:hypothetical protein
MVNDQLVRVIDPSILSRPVSGELVADDKRSVTHEHLQQRSLRPVLLLATFTIAGAVAPATTHRSSQVLRYQSPSLLMHTCSAFDERKPIVTENTNRNRPLLGMSEEDIQLKSPKAYVSSISDLERANNRHNRRINRKNNV